MIIIILNKRKDKEINNKYTIERERGKERSCLNKEQFESYNTINRFTITVY